MDWASSVSSCENLADALRATRDDIETQLAGSRPGFLVAFASPGYAESYGKIPDLVQDLFAPRVFLGCTAMGVIGGGREIEHPLEQGDFLIRHVIDIDQKRGTIGLDESIRNGQTVQFHLRHAAAATEDLDLMLNSYQTEKPGSKSARCNAVYSAPPGLR